MDQQWDRLWDVARRQHGTFSMRQAADCGIAPHRVRHRASRGDVETIHPNVFRVAGAPRSFEAKMRAIALWLGTRVAISHGSASRLLRLDLDAQYLLAHRDRVDVWLPGSVHVGRRNPQLRVHRTQNIPEHHRSFVDGIPVTTAARTVVDSAATLDSERLEALGESARRLGIMTIADLERALRDLGTRPGVAKVRKYVEQQRGDPALQYGLEIKLARLLRQARHLGSWQRQTKIAIGTPIGKVFRVDFAQPTTRVIIECDGFRWHGNHLRWKLDRARIAAIEAAEWRVVTVTWDDVVQRADQTVHRIALATQCRPLALWEHNVCRK